MKYYLYNEKANNGIKPDFFTEDMNIVLAEGLDYKEFFDSLKPEDEVVLVGGDGSIHYLVNAIDTETLTNRVYLRAAGTGNDFLKDINGDPHEEILLNEYLKGLPTVTVNGMTQKYINNVGFGIEGYCCEVADQIKAATPGAKVNYAAIAIKGLLGKFDPRHVTVTVDGKTFEQDNVWLASTMKGRFVGGGMMFTPGQDRRKHTLSVVTYCGHSRLISLLFFPSVFSGKHVKLTKIVKIVEGTEITVTYDKPCALQTDGETVLNVTTYSVKA